MTALMIQGTGSNVGKSLLVAGLCRAALRRGLRVAPFKPQNMSNNAAVTADGGEIGRAQALQARACGRPAISDMNPVLLKPETERGSRIVVQGRVWGRAEARDYAALKPRLMAPVLESFDRLRAEVDLVIVEGAGSPAEVNLRRHDIANMGFAQAAGVPVVLAGDIDRGGVIAQLVGCQAVLDPADAARVKGFVINKFRGDPALFEDGYRLIEARTGWRGYGVAPWFAHAHRLPAEDAVEISDGGARGGGASGGPGGVKIVCPLLSRIANFDDLDPLKLSEGVTVEMIAPGRALPGDAALALLPGTKSTLGDLAFLRAQGWDVDIAAHLRRGGRVLGICGGFQMLGRRIHDPDGVDGAPGAAKGLGLLDIETVMGGDKRLAQVAGRHPASGAAVAGYEIHMGASTGPDMARPFLEIDGRPEGAVSADGRVMGGYVHGLFASDGFRDAILREIGGAAGAPYEAQVEATLDALAAHLEAHLDVEGLVALARAGG